MEQAKDPVCGMTVDPATAAGRTTYESRDYYFCSDQCLRTFKAEPERYIGDTQQEPPYTKSGWIVAPKFGSAGSGGLENEPPEFRDDQ
jgi:P-type Cu+ transporter